MQLLSSLSTSPENDKMAYDVGFDLDASECVCILLYGGAK